MKHTIFTSKIISLLAFGGIVLPMMFGLNSSTLFGGINAHAQNATQITNTAVVSSPTTDTVSGNNTAVVNDRFCYSTDLAVTSFTDGVTSAQANAAITYTSVITNGGISRVQDIQFVFSFNTDYLNDSSISFSSTVGTITTGTTGTVGSVKTYTKVIQTSTTFINPSASTTLTISGLTVRPTATNGTSYTANLSITPTAPTFADCAIVDPGAGNNTGADSTTAVNVADLSLVKTSDGGGSSTGPVVGRLNAGQTVNYTMTVTNNGPSAAAANIVVTDTWPVARVTPTLVSGANYTASANWNCSFATPTITCTNTNALANAGTSSIVISGTVSQS